VERQRRVVNPPEASRASEPHAESHLRFEHGEARAETVMRTEPEGQVAVVTRRDVELVGPLEDGLVAVGGAEP
jgi:hypothetical protein